MPQEIQDQNGLYDIHYDAHAFKVDFKFLINLQKLLNTN